MSSKKHEVMFLNFDSILLKKSAKIYKILYENFLFQTLLNFLTLQSKIFLTKHFKISGISKLNKI